MRRLDAIDFEGKRVLEIGLGQGADSEQMIRRGAALWSGLDLSPESISRVATRLRLFERFLMSGWNAATPGRCPFADNSFDIVFSHGVLHHIPDVIEVQKEIARVLKPGGRLIVMLYARRSLNYLFSISSRAPVGYRRSLPGSSKRDRHHRRPYRKRAQDGAMEVPQDVQFHSRQHRRAIQSV